ncbi:7,8-dihydropterin-6-yl-methyl-4-(beta-D-ribofuranosyl)aminobenzene 5'-phosphate synthase [Bacilli bacterium PM5-3]|nr:7,8-dihydropterin-6-yl-methyl-4-(beta-D-ribofuranosyl)aminobenzene 5'-phosphate synthase [Bacilli bacterium PM5-3]MDH6603248.1 7,8-dihydropterin-6-yl-methyl-4-(beta-D-ribofuranosyl)aminobenzene 5'-phosphate synthase [Bacilli bacterium PM5-9]
MFLQVLVDNNTFIDDYALAEPALSFYLEDNFQKILFDTGYSDVLINNAKHYNIDLNNLDYIVISHGHNDHTRGLEYLIENYDLSNTILLAHPDIFNKKEDDDLDIGITISKEYLETKMKVILTKEPYYINNKLIFLGEIKRTIPFENLNPVGQELKDNIWKDDYVVDDSALIYENDDVFVITGCSHSGICNICEQAKQLTNKKISGIIGGFHLFDVDEQLNKTINYFKENNIKNLYPSHCVSFKAKAAINNCIPINVVGVGTKLDL